MKTKKPRVHIEDLFAKFLEFQAAQLHAMHLLRSPSQFKKAMDDAQNEFKAFCDEHNLPIDWTQR